LEGDREKIEEFIKALKKELIENFGNPIIKFTQFKEDSSIELPEIIRSSQALTIGQLQKGISVQLEILDALKGLAEDSKSLPERLAEKLKS
ncbi:hypothetical protein HZB88_04305, partial [archaeon]|nr:hypothetical protein [archaeon]